VTMFFFVSGGHDGGSAVNIGVTPVRIVCQNTLVMGLSAATVKASVAHTHDALGSVQFAVDTIAKMQTAKNAVAATMRLLASRTLDPALARSVVEAAYEADADSRATAQARLFLESTVELTPERRAQLEAKIAKRGGWVDNSVKAYREAAFDRLSVFNDEYPKVANTPWAAYNAVVEVEQYRRGKSSSVSARDLLFGGFRGKTVGRAFDRALALAKA
jgi:hypothetical protein